MVEYEVLIVVWEKGRKEQDCIFSHNQGLGFVLEEVRLV